MSEIEESSTLNPMFTLSVEEEEIITYNVDGLVPAVIQEKDTGEILMMA